MLKNFNQLGQKVQTRKVKAQMMKIQKVNKMGEW